ncbi:MAG: hypothetical protein UT32_C0011G0042 [Parcubacteria group bacterium GW2011_GWC2_39_14]|nr:MAG: hypothetical protein UT32_C0011G0042 [Parcubacteria group bacterium GW2011_GWC2_39_14]
MRGLPRSQAKPVLRGVAQLARVLGLGPRGRGFESHHPDHKVHANHMTLW